jgi:hypothetical protein
VTGRGKSDDARADIAKIVDALRKQRAKQERGQPGPPTEAEIEAARKASEQVWRGVAGVRGVRPEPLMQHPPVDLIRKLPDPEPLPPVEVMNVREKGDAPDQQNPTRLPSLSKDVATYAPSTIAKAVRLFEVGTTRNEVAELTARLKRPDATRVRNLWSGGLLPLNQKGKLVPSPRVARVRGRIALRYLDGAGGRWLDPKTDPPPPAQGGQG